MCFSSAVIALLSICFVISVTNCSKRNIDQQSNSDPRLKADTSRIHSLPPQDSLELIKNAFGQGILTHLQQYIDSTLTDFNILSDSIIYQTDSAVAYLTTISCTGNQSIKVGVLVNIPEKKKSTDIWVVWFRVCTCVLDPVCPCGCNPVCDHGYWVCPCAACYGNCKAVVSEPLPIIIW